MTMLKKISECYKDEMYIEAEKRLKQREAGTRKQAELEREKRSSKRRKEISEEYFKKLRNTKHRQQKNLENWKKN